MWRPNDTYNQAHGNELKYAGRVRGIGPNIMLVLGTIHLYHTLSQRKKSTNILQEFVSNRLREHRRVSKHCERHSCQNSRLRRQLSRPILDRLSHILPHRHLTVILLILWDRLVLAVQVIINDILKKFKLFTTMMFIYITYITQCL
jgi:hypothetical protein